MEYSWHMEEPGSQDTNPRNNSRNIQGRHPQGPGLIDELEAFMAPGGEGCYPAQDARRVGAHQLPESPPDSGSENPYSPSEVPHAIAVTQSVLGTDYMLVHDHLSPHEMIPQNGDYIYEELKNDSMGHLSDVVVLNPDPNLVDLGLRGVRHDLGMDYQRYSQMRVDMPDLDQNLVTPGLVPPVYSTLMEPSVKKRKHSVDGQLKCEPAVLSPDTLSPRGALRPAPPSVDGSEAGDDAPFQCIRFSAFQQTSWWELYDAQFKCMTPPSYVVGADKGFNYSQIDEAFVCQKKNHFQVTCQIQIVGDPHYVKTGEGFKKINGFFLHFYGVKAEDPTQEVRVEQSQSDRTKKPFHPVPVELRREGTKVTIGRLHFAETTNNNMRKKGRPNPDQRHFQLVVALRAHCQSNDYMLCASASDRIIVRASNPGQFESDCSESWWQRGVSENSVHFNGRVGINTDRPDESCVINGNLKVMGHIVHPSDARAKHNIEELDTAQQLKNVQSIRVVKFNYDPSFAEHSGLVGFDPSSPAPRSDTGVIAQEIRSVLPEAVKEAGDVTLHTGHTIPNFLVVNKDRIFMENLGAVKELCKVTGNLESRIDQLERINKKLCKISVLHRRDSARSSISNDSRFSGISTSSKSLYSDGNISIDQIRDIARNIRRHECCHKLSHNSPKYTRKQCKNCHSTHTTKYGKYYNSNKTNSVRYHSGKDEKTDSCHMPKFDSSEKPVLPVEEKNKDTCLWVRNSESERSFCGSKFAFCCRKSAYGDTELISNKFLQIVITILIFIMAVCLVVMSALYFREHQELLSMKEIRMQDKYTNLGKFSSMYTAPPHRVTQGENGHQNQIQNSKHSQHTTAKKTAKEKGPHKTTTAELLTTPSLPPESISWSAGVTAQPQLPQDTYVNNVLNIEQPAPPSGHAEHLVTSSVHRDSEVVGSGCPLDNVLTDQLDVDCQTSCNLDPPQAYDNQEPVENNPDKDLNETANYARPIDKSLIPIVPEKNQSESKMENDSLKNLRDEISMAESNLLDPSKMIVNATDNETAVRLKRGAEGKAGLKTKYKMAASTRPKRETSEAVQRSGFNEMFIDHQEEIDGSQDCDTVTFGVTSKTVNNDSMFKEIVCLNRVYNFTYSVPVSKCLKDKHVEINFKSPKYRKVSLCDYHCKYDTVKNCQLNREIGKPVQQEDHWFSKMQLDCRMDRTMRVRASSSLVKDPCFLTTDQGIHFIEFNINLYRDCHN